jgi:hypothetical protein
LTALQRYICEGYTVAYMDFQFLSDAVFETEADFVMAFADELGYVEGIPQEIEAELESIAHGNTENVNLRVLFKSLSRWCGISEKPVVLIIDEVDSATNNQVFLDFLAQLRGYYLHREKRSTFQSVILAGVYDVKNVKRKIRPAILFWFRGYARFWTGKYLHGRRRDFWRRSSFCLPKKTRCLSLSSIN